MKNINNSESNTKKQDSQEKFINIYAYISKKKNNNNFHIKSIIKFFSIICICIILGLLVVCLIKFCG